VPRATVQRWSLAVCSCVGHGQRQARGCPKRPACLQTPTRAEVHTRTIELATTGVLPIRMRHQRARIANKPNEVLAERDTPIRPGHVSGTFTGGIDVYKWLQGSTRMISNEQSALQIAWVHACDPFLALSGDLSPARRPAGHVAQAPERNTDRWQRKLLQPGHCRYNHVSASLNTRGCIFSTVCCARDQQWYEGVRIEL